MSVPPRRTPTPAPRQGAVEHPPTLRALNVAGAVGNPEYAYLPAPESKSASDSREPELDASTRRRGGSVMIALALHAAGARAAPALRTAFEQRWGGKFS
jgi:hypothetical protein